MFSKILLATTPADESKGASNVSFALARPSRSKLYIFHAYGLPEEGWSAIRYLLPSGKVEEVKKELENYFSPQLSKIENYEVDVVPGIPQDEILRFARKKNVDLIVMGPHRLAENQPRIWGLTGSTLQKVSLKARCPVMIVPPDVPRIFPVDDVVLSEQDRKNFLILIVDDELSMRDSLREWLEEEGFSADMAESGPVALEMLGKKQYQLMLTDIKMPEMDGVTLLTRAKQKDPGMAVVMMTAYATIDTALNAMKKGALDYLVKPFDPGALIPTVMKIHQDYEMIRGRLKMAFKNIVLAMDFSEPALCAFNYAFEIAKGYDASLHIFYAMPLMENDEYPSAEQIELQLQEAVEKMKTMFGTKLAGVVDYTIGAWEGAPHVEILKFARISHADLIIMAHHSKEKDPEKAVIGSTTIKVASGAFCPVLSINRDFVPKPVV